MECITCKTKMVCYNDVNNIAIRIDWLRCPNCGSHAEVQYDASNINHIEHVNWSRTFPKQHFDLEERILYMPINERPIIKYTHK